MTLTSEIRIKLFSGKQVGQHPGIKLKQATKYSDSLVPKVGGSTSPEWWVNINRNGGSTWSGIYNPGLLLIAAQMLMFIRSAPLAQNHM
jgi:hypothetical protein